MCRKPNNKFTTTTFRYIKKIDEKSIESKNCQLHVSKFRLFNHTQPAIKLGATVPLKIKLLFILAKLHISFI